MRTVVPANTEPAPKESAPAKRTRVCAPAQKGVWVWLQGQAALKAASPSLLEVFNRNLSVPARDVQLLYVTGQSQLRVPPPPPPESDNRIFYNSSAPHTQLMMMFGVI